MEYGSHHADPTLGPTDKIGLQIFMTPNNNSQIQVLANGWAEQLKADPTFTYSDAEELKCHLVDLCEELVAKGLTEEESFLVASRRIGNFSNMKTEFEEVNTPIIQMRKAILVLSGVFVFFLLYFLMRFIITILTLISYLIKADEVHSIRYIIQYLTVFHLFFVIFTIVIYFRGKKVIERIKSLNVLPVHTFLIFIGVVALAVADLWFNKFMRILFDFGSNIRSYLITIFDYTSYTFPLTIAVCFLFLYKKYCPSDSSDKLYTKQEYITDDQIDDDQILKEKWGSYLAKLQQIGLNEDEAHWVISKRKGMGHEPQSSVAACCTNNRMSTLLIILSGVLVYFFIYFLLFSTGKILFTLLQYVVEDNPILNIKRTWSYVIIFQIVFIFMTISLYLHDKNLVQQIKRINFRPVHTRWLFWITFLLATVDRCFYPIYRNAAGLYSEQNLVFRIKITKVFFYTGYSFPIVVCSCFLLLFYKYYRNNVKIG